MGFQMQICSILHFSWSILVKCCVHLQMSSNKTQCFFWRRIHVYSTSIDCLVIDSSRLFCLLSIICKQQLEQYNYSSVQSALMTGFWRDIMSSVWSQTFLLTKHPSAAMSEEKLLLFTGQKVLDLINLQQLAYPSTQSVLEWSYIHLRIRLSRPKPKMFGILLKNQALSKMFDKLKYLFKLECHVWQILTVQYS